MLKFIKTLFKNEEKKEEINLDDIDLWLEKKIIPIRDALRYDINGMVDGLNEEKSMVFERITALQNAKLQNPNIPERAKTIMQGNREAFIKKTFVFLSRIDLQYEEFQNLDGKCKALEQDMEEFAKSTARSYQILSQFFAREVSIIAESIKKIESTVKNIRDNIKHGEIEKIDGIKDKVKDIQEKIRLKKYLREGIKEKKAKLEEEKTSLEKAYGKIAEIQGSEGYKEYLNLSAEKKVNKKNLDEIQGKILHDFSVLEKALKKYSKIAFENQNWIDRYLNSPMDALVNDDELIIASILTTLKIAVQENKLELDQKKNDKILRKIKCLNKEYFSNLQKEYKKMSDISRKINFGIENNDAKKLLESYSQESDVIKGRIENLKSEISVCDDEQSKIDIDGLKKRLQEEIGDALNEKVNII